MISLFLCNIPEEIDRKRSLRASFSSAMVFAYWLTPSHLVMGILLQYVLLPVPLFGLTYTGDSTPSRQ